MLPTKFEKIHFLIFFAKKFGEGNLFIVSLHQICERGRIWLSLSSRISLVTRQDLQALENHLCSTWANAVHQPDLQPAHQSVQRRGTGTSSEVQIRADQHEHRIGRRNAESSVRDCVQSADQVQELARLRDCKRVREVGLMPLLRGHYPRICTKTCFSSKYSDVLRSPQNCKLFGDPNLLLNH